MLLYELNNEFKESWFRVFYSDGSKPRPGSGSARPVLFSRDRARNSKKGPSLTQARDRFLEKGLENWDFYVVKNTGSSRLGIELLWRAWARARLEIDFQGSGSARDRFFRARPITTSSHGNSNLEELEICLRKNCRKTSISSCVRIGRNHHQKYVLFTWI